MDSVPSGSSRLPRPTNKTACMTALPCRVQPFSTDPRREPSSCKDLRQDGQNDFLEPVRSTRYDSPGVECDSKTPNSCMILSAARVPDHLGRETPGVIETLLPIRNNGPLVCSKLMIAGEVICSSATQHPECSKIMLFAHTIYYRNKRGNGVILICVMGDCNRAHLR